MSDIDKVRGFSAEQDYSSFSVIRLHPRQIKELGGLNTWVKVTCGEQSIYRMALGARSAKGFTHKSAELDYDSCLELGSVSGEKKDENGFYSCQFKVEKAPPLGKLVAHWKHPDPGYRVPMQLSMVSFSLGMISLFISLAG